VAPVIISYVHHQTEKMSRAIDAFPPAVSLFRAHVAGPSR